MMELFRPKGVLQDEFLTSADSFKELILKGTDPTSQDAVAFTDPTDVNTWLVEVEGQTALEPTAFLAPMTGAVPSTTKTSTFRVYQVNAPGGARMLCRSSFIRTPTDARHSVAHHAEEAQRVAAHTNAGHTKGDVCLNYSIHVAPVLGSFITSVALREGYNAMVQHVYLRLANCNLEDWIRSQMRFVARLSPLTTEDPRPAMFYQLFACIVQFMTQALIGARAVAVGAGITHRGLHARHVLLRDMTREEAQYDYFSYGIQAIEDGPEQRLVLPTHIISQDQRVPLPIVEITDFRHAIAKRIEFLDHIAYSQSGHEMQQEMVDMLRERLGQAFDPIMLVSSVQRVVEDVFVEEDLGYDLTPASGVPGSTWFRHTLRLMSNNHTVGEIQDEGVCELYVERHSVSPLAETVTGAEFLESVAEWNAALAVTAFMSSDDLPVMKEAVDDERRLVVYEATPRTQHEWLAERYDQFRSPQKWRAPAESQVYVFDTIPWQWSGFAASSIEDVSGAEAGSIAELLFE